MKVKVKYLYSWLPTRTYHKNLEFWNFLFFKIWQTWAIFSMKDPSYRLKSYFSS